MATLRAPSNERLTQMGNQLINYISKIAGSHDLVFSVDWKEKFHVTKNNPNAVKILKKVAKNKNIKIINIRQPVSWTEDFSYFLEKTPGAMFGLGAGVNHASLHSQNYDFPDSILRYGVDICIQLIKEINSYYNPG
jgi:metal-dependent amidase/aminoacylase/carboxypeptidase family protein